MMNPTVQILRFSVSEFPIAYGTLDLGVFVSKDPNYRVPCFALVEYKIPNFRILDYEVASS